jgi:hypothetical protein
MCGTGMKQGITRKRLADANMRLKKAAMGLYSGMLSTLV